MAKIFISHSTKNQTIIRDFVRFMQMGMGIAREEIFCTSFPNTLPTGEAFIETIRKELINCEAAIFLITEEYLASPFCVAELGAAWGLCKKIYPILLVELDRIENTPLKGLQVLFLECENDITVLYDDLFTKGIIPRRYTAEYMNHLPQFMKQIKAITKGEFLLQEDEDGYYHTEITGVRNVREEFRCYKIKGHVSAWESENMAKTDWIFFRKGMYEELKVGDKVRFKFSKTEVKSWPDLGLARNIYPADLVKER